MISNIKKAFGLVIALLIGGVWTAQAQSVSISPNSSGGNTWVCMLASSTGTPFQAIGVDLDNGTTTGTIVDYTWTALGGIDIDGAPSGTASGASLSTIIVKPKTGINYPIPEQYSKYAKGKLRVTIKVEHSYEYQQRHCDENGVWYTPETYTYYVNYTSEIEIRKEFSDLTGNEITGPECVKTGDRVTYSVAPWVSLFQLNTVGFDNYYWNIPPGVAQNDVLYYSADESSVTFIVGNSFEGETISVRMGACNLSTQTAITLTLKAEPGQPTLPQGIDFATGWCLPLDVTIQQRSLTIGNTNTDATYVWENLGGWLPNPSETTFEVKPANSYTLSFTPQDDARTLRLRVTSSCGTEQIYNLDVNRTLATHSHFMQTILGSTCVTPNSVVQLMVTHVGSNVPMTWTIDNGASSGWYIIPGTETSARPLVFAGSGNATITATLTGCSGTSITQTFGIIPQTPILNVATPVCVTPGEEQTFGIRHTDPNTVSYHWAYPSGWLLTGPADQSSITMIPNNNGGTLEVRAVGSHCMSSWEAVTIPQQPTLNLNRITQCVDAGLPGYIEIEIVGYDAAKNVPYDIDIDDTTFGTIDPAGIDANGIFKVNTTGKVGKFAVIVSAPNTCGGTMSDTLFYDVQKDNFIAEERVIVPDMLSMFEVKEPFSGWYANQSIVWTVNGQTPYATPVGFPQMTDLVYTSLIPQQDSIIYVTVTDNTTGCSTTKYRVLDNGVFQPQLRSGGAVSANEFETVYISDEQNTERQFALYPNLTSTEFTLYPNPASTELTIDAPAEGNINFHIISMTGSIVREGVNQQPKTTIDVSDLPTGTYIVTVLQGANRYAKQFIKK